MNNTYYPDTYYPGHGEFFMYDYSSFWPHLFWMVPLVVVLLIALKKTGWPKL